MFNHLDNRNHQFVFVHHFKAGEKQKRKLETLERLIASQSSVDPSVPLSAPSSILSNQALVVQDALPVQQFVSTSIPSSNSTSCAWTEHSTYGFQDFPLDYGNSLFGGGYSPLNEIAQEPQSQSDQTIFPEWLDSIPTLPSNVNNVLSSNNTNPLISVSTSQSTPHQVESDTVSNIPGNIHLQTRELTSKDRERGIRIPISTLLKRYRQLTTDQKRGLLRSIVKSGLHFVDATRSQLDLPDSNSTTSSVEAHRYDESFPDSTDPQCAPENTPLAKEPQDDTVSITHNGHRHNRQNKQTPIITLPSLYTNNFRIHQVSFFAAIFSNARALGFEFDDYLEEDSISPVCISAHPSSPFPSPSGPPAATINQTQLQTHQKKFSSVPRDLRPTANQIATTHHPYLDLFPFPTFRNRAIAAQSTTPPLIDENELCLDLTSDGLICWGAAETTTTGLGNVGVPWSMRSWEPQGWFLRKYWFLIGGGDGNGEEGEGNEMMECARWWRGIRGEDGGEF
ncbi:MAG: hypothetical protein M1834_006028 [Cirrosporium novae-zelandiae]|nr:MAG: hypothetical protein M1834_006028 [Cirrosporium novae-zelandiae]